MIPNLADPKLRALYGALLGKREATWAEKAVILAVAAKLEEAREILGAENDRIAAVIERAWRIDRVGFLRRLYGWLDEAKERAVDR
jgi:hypothetical protein